MAVPQRIPWEVTITPHPGSSPQDILNEPDWIQLRAHAIGFKNHEGRRPGLTEPEVDRELSEAEIAEARRKREEIRQRVSAGDLVNFRDLIEHQTSFHLRHPGDRSLGWRYVLETTEDWVKYGQRWPVNVEREEKERKQEGKKKGNAGEKDGQVKDEREPASEDGKAKEQNLSPQQRALLCEIESESNLLTTLKQNSGHRVCPQTQNRSTISIDAQDQFTPDNWLPRSSALIRLTGNHPFNAEPSLSDLFAGGLITPNELHFVRNHGAVPRLLWELHHLEISGFESSNAGGNERKCLLVSLSMHDLKTRFSSRMINIPVAMACTGNRRKEMNLLRKTKGANNGAGSVGCAYWKGPLVRDVLLDAGVVPSTGQMDDGRGRRLYVNFAGADNPSGGPYETSLPLEYVMNPANDVLLALYMNDLPLPPDHGYPVRLVVPGHVGGRSVKWLKRIWITDHENQSYYHIWDNRLLPEFIRDTGSEIAKALFHHPSSAIYEQPVNAVVCRPGQGEKIPLNKAKAGEMYHIQGFAYAGAGLEVQRVEVSIDGGKKWLWAKRKFPDFPIRHGNKFWAWVFWDVEVELAKLVRAPNVIVRCWDATKNRQPPDFEWNVLGMMNNSWYTVKTDLITEQRGDGVAIMFRHPTEAASLSGGWMQPSQELLLAQTKQEGGIPEKQFTREEIEKHDKPDACWMVINNKVYDVTSVLEWHPGGKASIMTHAGKCHYETTEQFESIHDEFAHHKLRECLLGSVTEKTAKYIQQTAEVIAKERATRAEKRGKGGHLALELQRWLPVRLVDRRSVSRDTRTYTFELPEGKSSLGVETCQHIQVGFHLQDKMVVRSYTPTRPVIPSPPGVRETSQRTVKSCDKGSQAKGPPTPPESPTSTGHSFSSTASTSNRPESHAGQTNPAPTNENRTFDLTIKTYFPTPSQPGGALSNLLDCMPLGEEVEIRGPTGDVIYEGHSTFLIRGANPHDPHSAERRLRFPRVSLVLGGSGITPGYALMARVMSEIQAGEEAPEVRAVDANKTEGDILLREELERFVKESQGRIRVTHILSQPGDDWKGERGLVNANSLKRVLFPPGEGNAVFLCGPPGLIKGVALPALNDWGYVEDENIFGF